MILVHGKQRSGNVVDKYHAENNEQQPRESAESRDIEHRGIDPVGDQRSRLRKEHRTHEHHQAGEKSRMTIFTPLPR